MDNIFSGAPGPSPWYLRGDPPIIPGFRWEEQTAFTLLVGENGPVAAFGMYNYIMALDGIKLLVWNQRSRPSYSGPSEPINISIIEPHQLRTLDNDFATSWETAKSYRGGFILGGEPLPRMMLQTTNAEDEIAAEFPAQFHPLEEILILCHSSGIPDKPNCVDLALIVAQPRLSKYRLYPQDWFNCSDFDFGYQWVTRIVRHPKTGFVHGEGFRIAPFILDDSLRNLRSAPQK